MNRKQEMENFQSLNSPVDSEPPSHLFYLLQLHRILNYEIPETTINNSSGGLKTNAHISKLLTQFDTSKKNLNHHINSLGDLSSPTYTLTALFLNMAKRYPLSLGLRQGGTVCAELTYLEMLRAAIGIAVGVQRIKREFDNSDECETTLKIDNHSDSSVSTRWEPPCTVLGSISEIYNSEES